MKRVPVSFVCLSLYLYTCTSEHYVRNEVLNAASQFLWLECNWMFKVSNSFMFHIDVYYQEAVHRQHVAAELM